MQEDFPCRREDARICRINPPLGEEEWIFVVVFSCENGKLLLSRKRGKTYFCDRNKHESEKEDKEQLEYLRKLREKYENKNDI